MKTLARCAGVLSAALSAGLLSQPAPAAGAGQVELQRYLGLWREQARTPNFFEDNAPIRDGERLSACYGATAIYREMGDGKISVVNRCKRQTADGKVVDDAAKGRAEVLNAPDNTRLRVGFGPAVARFFQRLVSNGEGNYWIYALGPIDEKGRYSWSVVSGPDKDYIFILTREADPDRAALQPALDAAKEAGLPVDKLIFTREPL